MSAPLVRAAERARAQGLGWAGLAGDALAHVLAGLAQEGQWLVVVDEPDAAERLLRGLRFFHARPERILAFPADDVRPYDGFSPRRELPATRLRTLDRVAQGEPCVVVAPAVALARRAPSAQARREGRRVLEAGARLDPRALAGWLTASGYLMVDRVTDPNTFAHRGDVLDVWGPLAKDPVRVDFFDDEIESVRAFEASTGRVAKPRPRVILLGVREERLDTPALERLKEACAVAVTAQRRGTQLRRRVIEEVGAGIRFSGIEAWLPALSEVDAPLTAFAGVNQVLVHPDDVAAALREFERSSQARWEALDDEERPLVTPAERNLAPQAVLDGLSGAVVVYDFHRPGESVDLGARLPEGFGIKSAELGPVATKLRELAGKGVAVGLVTDTWERGEGLVEMLANHELRVATAASVADLPTDRVSLLVGDLPRGFVAHDAGLALIPASAIFGARQASRRTSAVHAFFDAALSDLSQLKEGDPVVHKLHGIGLYRGLKRLPLGEHQQDFVALEYRDGDLLYLPVAALGALSRYTPARTQPKITLDRLGGQTWASRTGKVRDSVLGMANDLLALYAKRELAERPAWPPPGDVYHAFEARFPFTETPDQAKAIEAVMADLSLDRPMDRLVVGDVGFGKTEVAMRAAMRVVEAGGQVALLCPTTVLAFQHARTFRERFQASGVRVELLSRFRSPAEERAVLAGLARGEVDIVIGTTKLLSRSVRYKQLGLVVVDEEHRFGVKQKEQFKKLRASVDVLAMSATPIPRTLEMALSGLRELSVMATPPEERLAVRTSVTRLKEARVRDAILREKARGGQVYFVHNRVQDLDQVAALIQSWVPEVTMTVAHGQMADEQLERELVRFIEGEVDMLVCSSIIESGVDLPNVNTMLINDADRFGIAQLYQLRGRVGRGSTRGECILLTPEQMTRDARRRVQVIVEAADLGAGFQVAHADLELRGGGNLVGESQSGSIDAVGYEMWIELLKEAVSEARGDLDRRRIQPEVQVPTDAFLPDNLIRDTQDRLGWYRRLAGADTESELDRLANDLEFEVGELPEAAQNLIGQLRTGLQCRQWGITRLSWLQVRVLMELHEASALGPERLNDLVARHPKRVLVQRKPGEPVRVELRFTPSEARWPYRFLRWWFTQLKA